MTEQEPRKGDSLILMNQVSGPLFREAAEDLAEAFDGVSLVTGHSGDHARQLPPSLRIRIGPGYDRGSNLRRVVSWFRFFLFALRQALCANAGTPMLLVSNPPFLPLVGWVAAKLRGQRYGILIYDLYPGMLENLGKIAPGGVIARVWRRFNRLTWSRASVLITIGESMAANIRREMAPRATAPAIHVIPNWVDTEFIRPRPKKENQFAIQHDQVGKLTVLYAGNLGHSHDLRPVFEAAGALRSDPRFAFLIIGDGAQRNSLETRMEQEQLGNVRMLPFQPEAVLPDLLSTGEIAVVTFQKGAEGYMVPSKTAYAMAAGSALLVLASGANEVSQIVEEYGCGLSATGADTSAVIAALLRFADNPAFLADCRNRARQAAERHFSRRNTKAYAAVLGPLVESRPK